MSEPTNTPTQNPPASPEVIPELMEGITEAKPAEGVTNEPTPATTPASPGTGKSEWDWLTGSAPDPNQAPPQGEDPPASPPAQNQPPVVDPPQPQDVDAVLAKYLGEPGANITGEKLSQFKGLRGVASEFMKKNQALELENAQLKSSGPVAQIGEGQVLPETDAVKQMQATIDSLTPLAEAGKEFQARKELADNHSFKLNHDAPRASILRELGATAKEVELSEDDVKQYLSLPSEFKQQKWIEDNVEDDTAAGLFKEKGAKFLGLTNDRSDALSAEDPFEQLNRWDEYEAAFGNKMAVKLDEDISRQYQAAATRKFQELTSEDGDLFFKTPAGQEVLSGIQKQFADGIGMAPEVVVDALAHKPMAEAYQAIATKFGQENAELNAEIARLKGLDPAAGMVGSPPASPPAAGGTVDAGGVDDGINVFGGSGDVVGVGKTLISSEQLAEAQRQA